jgi:hypothetical protein
MLWFTSLMVLAWFEYGLGLPDDTLCNVTFGGWALIPCAAVVAMAMWHLAYSDLEF